MNESKPLGAEEASANSFEALQTGQRIAATYVFSEEAIRSGAEAINETAYLHRDPDQAAQSRFGGLIAAGGHTAGVMIAVVSSYFAGKSLGMELTCRYLGAVHSGDTLSIEWEITHLEPKARWQGGTVTLKGTATNQRGEVPLTAEATILVSPLI